MGLGSSLSGSSDVKCLCFGGHQRTDYRDLMHSTLIDSNPIPFHAAFCARVNRCITFIDCSATLDKFVNTRSASFSSVVQSLSKSLKSQISVKRLKRLDMKLSSAKKVTLVGFRVAGLNLAFLLLLF